MQAAPRSVRNIRSAAAAVVAGVLLAGAPAEAQTPPPKPVEAPKAAASAPRRTETVVYDNWTVTCRDGATKNAARSCSASLRVINNKTQQNLVIWEIGNDATGKPAVALRVPLGVLTRPGVVLTIGSGKPRKFDYVMCDRQGCEAAGPFDNALARELGAAAEASVTIVATNGQPIAFKVPLKGIAQAVPALRD
ncbi:invasion associated locus B family protein [Kaistia geumhonensis]|uniref:Invasion protein IalB n=1 Tax=Kaistia geumhonensis TaxID=410839 RepID=A0ABU0MCI4_9HYPH|nr:invasion associated locus B family protein [Kaistia geumhonensis]MCX5481597.1 invasion associated locus B family protein [Kaistia geumhonensis]MDQ0518663.1 invasion protein IalB [Kaistia geumhonensis]